MVEPVSPSRSAAQQSAESGMSQVVHRNISALMEVRQRQEQQRTIADRIADAITSFAGTIWFALLHLLLFGGWILINAGWVRGVKPFDPFPFVMLAMIASVEAIFLATFILISQNRMQRLADRRAELDLQISLLTEHELTRAIQLLDAMSRRLGGTRPPEEELRELEKDVSPQKVVEEIEKAEQTIAEARKP